MAEQTNNKASASSAQAKGAPGNNTASALPPMPRLFTYSNPNLRNARDNSSNNNNKSNIKYINRLPVSHTITNRDSSSPGLIQNQSAVDSGGGVGAYHEEDNDAIELSSSLVSGPQTIGTVPSDPAAYHLELMNRSSPFYSAAVSSNNNNSHFLGRLTSKENVLFMGDELVDIGRNSTRSSVTFHVGKSSFVSRKHMQIFYYQNDFYLTCLSKNGIFIDGVFTRKTQQPLRLPKSCNFRFPSTNIRISFENLDVPDNYESNNQSTSVPSPTSSVVSSGSIQPSFDEQPHLMYAPISVSIVGDRKSPFPSPTGTISAANSCPTSPRPIFTEYTNYSTPCASTTTYTPNDIFQPPSSSSYGEHEKPPYSYAQLIVQSISASPEKQLTLSGIYSFISKNYPYYRTGANKGWQNSIRHNLSLNRYFIKVPRSQDEPGKGSFWRIDPTSELKLIDQSYRKRRQRGTQFPFGMPRSAPVSPSHIDLLLHFVDNSTENSPLHDITMQSAPGSPGNYHISHSDPQSIEDGSSVVHGHDTQDQEGSSHIYPTYIVTPGGTTATIKRELIEHEDDSSDNIHEYAEYEVLKRRKYSDN